MGKKTKCRSVCRHIYQEEINKTVEYLQTIEAKQTIKDRKIYAELVSAESKTLHGLRQTRYRWLWKVAIQSLLTAFVQNIKRLVKHFEPELQKEQRFWTISCKCFQRFIIKSKIPLC
ncbi:MAG: transposase [Endomicrobiia bacterium]